MTKTVRGTKYRKVKNRGGRFGPGRVHLIFYSKMEKTWKYVCSKRDQGFGITDDEVPDDTPVTCRYCIKYAGNVVEVLEDLIEDLEDLQ